MSSKYCHAKLFAASIPGAASSPPEAARRGANRAPSSVRPSEELSGLLRSIGLSVDPCVETGDAGGKAVEGRGGSQDGVDGEGSEAGEGGGGRGGGGDNGDSGDGEGGMGGGGGKGGGG